jgi:hypothetical protein
LSIKLKRGNKNIMQHRITLSTELLIAVRDRANKAKERRTKPSDDGVTIPGEQYVRHIAAYANNDRHFTLYGQEHAEAV